MTKMPQSYYKMVEELAENFGEYREMGCCFETYLLGTIYRERVKANDLTMKIDYLEKSMNKQHAGKK